MTTNTNILHRFWHLRAAIVVAVVVIGVSLGSRLAYATGINARPSLLVNTESFDQIDQGDGTSDRELRFGTSGTKLAYNITQSRFVFSNSISVLGNISGSTLTVSGNANITGSLLVKQNITARGTVSGALITQNGAGNNYLMGNVGVGTTAPKAKFDVVGAMSGTSLTLSGITGNTFVLDGNSVVFDATNNRFGIRAGASPKTTLEVNGIMSGSTLRVSGPADVQGNLTASGSARFDQNLTLNDDLTAADATLTFGNSVSSGVMNYSNTFREFAFDHGIRTSGSISGSGTLVWEGAGSGASLYLGSSLQGAGLSDCADNSTKKILWSLATGRFTCGDDQGGAGGLTLGSADERYLRKSGGTMTGALAIQNGNTHTATNSALLNVRGVMSGRSLFITGSGSRPTLYTDTSKGNVGIGTNSPTDRLTISGGTLLSTPGGITSTASGVELVTTASGVFVSGNFVFVGRNSTTGNDFVSIDITNPDSPEIVGGIDLGTSVGPIFVSTRNAFIGLQGSGGGSGFVILDNSNHAAPTVVSRLKLGAQITSIYVSGKYAYVGTSGMTTGPCSAKSQLFAGCDFFVVDFTSITNPRIVGGIQFATQVNAVYVQNRYAYVGLNSVAGNDFRIIDLANPAGPVTVGGTDFTNTVKSLYVSGKYTFLGLATDAGTEMRVMDTTIKTAPVQVGSYEAGATINAISVMGDWARLVVGANAGDEYQTIDMRNPKLPKKVGGLSFSTDGTNLAIAGKYAFATTTASAGLEMRVLDLNGIEAPAATIGTLQTANLSVSDNVRFDNNVYIRSALNVGRGGIISKGPVSVQSTGTGWVLAGTGVQMSAFDVRNGTGQLLFNVTDDGVVSGGIPNSTTGSTMQMMNHPVWGKQTGWAVPITTTATALTSAGLSTLTPVNAGVSAAGVAADRSYVKFASLNTSGNGGGIVGPYTSTTSEFRPRYTGLIRTSTGTTNLRFWGGLASASTIALAPSLTSNASGLRYVAMAWEDTVNQGKWMCCSGDGTNNTCVDMGGPPVSTLSTYFLDVDYTKKGVLTCRLNANGRVYMTKKTTNLPVGSTALGVQTSITTKVTGGAAVCRNFYIGKIGLEQN